MNIHHMSINGKKTCSLCSGEMEYGFLWGHYELGRASIEWGRKTEGFIDHLTSQKIEVRSYRCTKCGYLQNFA